MRSTALILLFFVPIFGYSVSASDGLGVRETAAQAFLLQTQGKYEELLQLYDPVTVGDIAEAFRGVLSRKRSIDRERNDFLRQVFGSDDREELMQLSSVEVMARLFSFLFASQLNDNQSEALQAAQFQFESLEQAEDGVSTVRYTIDFSATGGGQSGPKSMKLRHHDDSWIIVVDPRVTAALTQIISAL